MKKDSELLCVCVCVLMRAEYLLFLSMLPADEKDVFDKLFEEAPEKLEPVKRVSGWTGGWVCGRLSR